MIENEEEVQRFVRAMKTMMPIRHPNIVEIHRNITPTNILMRTKDLLKDLERVAQYQGIEV